MRAASRRPPRRPSRSLAGTARTSRPPTGWCAAARSCTLLVDDWADTGATATAVQQLVGDAGAAWVGAAVVVDAMNDSRLRRSLGIRSLLHMRDLPPVPRR